MAPRRLRSRPLSALALGCLAAVTTVACGRGVYRDPPRARADGGADTGGGGAVTPDARADGADGVESGGGGDGRPRLSGRWAPCGTMGTGGPQRATVSGDGKVVAFLFRQGQVAVHRISDQALLLELATTFGPEEDDYNQGIPPTVSDVFFRSHALALSPDGALVAVAGKGHVAVWRVPDGAKLFDIEGVYHHLTFAPNGTTFVADNELRSTADGHVILRLIDSDLAGRPLGFAAGGTQVLGFAGAVIRTYAANGAGTLLATTPVDPEPMLATSDMAFSPNGRYFAGYEQIGFDYRLFVIDTTTGRRLAIGAAATGAEPVFSPDENTVLLARLGYPEHDLVDLKTGAVRPIGATLNAPGAWGWPTGSGALGLGGEPLFMTDPTGAYWAAHPLDGPNYKPFPTLPGRLLPFLAMAASPDGKRLATISTKKTTDVERVLFADSNMGLWDVGGRRATAAPAAWARSVSFSADSKRLLIAAERDDTTALQEWQLGATAPGWNLARAGICSAIYLPPPRSDAVAVSLSDGVAIAAVGDDRLSPTLAVGAKCPAIAVSPHDGGLTLATSAPALWRITDGARLWPASAPAAAPIPDGFFEPWVAFAPDGSTILSSTYHHTAPPPFFRGTTSAFQSTDTYDGSAHVLNAADGAALQDLGLFGRRPVFSPDGVWITSGRTLWNVESAGSTTLGDPIGVGYGAVPFISTFLADGTIAVGRENGIIELFCPQ